MVYYLYFLYLNWYHQLIYTRLNYNIMYYLSVYYYLSVIPFLLISLLQNLYNCSGHMPCCSAPNPIIKKTQNKNQGQNKFAKKPIDVWWGAVRATQLITHTSEILKSLKKSYISDVDILKTRKFGIRAHALIKTENEKCSQKWEINLPPETYTDCIMSTSTVASKSAYAPLWRPMFFSYSLSDILYLKCF